MSRVITSLQHYEALGAEGDFRQKSATSTINGLKLAAGVCTPVQIAVADNADSTLMVPFEGRCTSLVGGKSLEWQAGRNALFLPNVGRGGFCDTRSVLMIDIQAGRLQDVARAMLGLEPDAHVDFRLGQERTVDLTVEGIDFAAVLKHLCGVIDAMHGHSTALSALKLDDQFYRLIALMLRPGLMATEVVRKRSLVDRALDPVCDYVMSHLAAPIGLSDMEQVSGLSRRSLQYAFWQRYEFTPMQWVREQRLLRAHALLSKPMAVESVTDAALQSGFVNVGAFAGAYRKRFGDYPSDTLRLCRAS